MIDPKITSVYLQFDISTFIKYQYLSFFICENSENFEFFKKKLKLKIKYLRKIVLKGTYSYMRNG